MSIVAQKLGPMVSFVVMKLKALPEPKIQHKHGTELLLDMLPQDRRKDNSTSLLPVSQIDSRSSSVSASKLNPWPQEVEATEQTMPEIGGLERRVYEVQASEVAAVELRVTEARKSAVDLEAAFDVAEME